MRLKGYLGDRVHDLLVEEVEGGYQVNVDGALHQVDAVCLEGTLYSLIVRGNSYEVFIRPLSRDRFLVRRGGFQRIVKVMDLLAAIGGAQLAHSGRAEVEAVMPGRVVKLLVEEGEEVAEGQGLIILEAMKMENEVPAPRAGRVVELFARAGKTLETGDKIAVIE